MTGPDQPVMPQRDLREQAWDRVIEAEGTAHIFQRRAQVLRWKLRLLTFSGLVIPLIVGGLAIGYGAGLPGLSVIIAVSAALAIAQVVVALWALVAGWADGYASAARSMVENRSIALDLEEFAKSPPRAAAAARERLAVLTARDDARRAQDESVSASAREKRRGMRAGLRRVGRPCAGCSVVPIDMNSTECGVCGQF